MLRSQLALLAQELGGYKELAELFDVDATLLERFILSNDASRKEKDLLQRAYSNLRLDDEFWSEYNGNDLDYIDDLTDIAQPALDNLTSDLQGELLDAIANNQIDQSHIEIDDATGNSPLDVFRDLTLHQSEMIVDWLHETGQSAKDFLEAYLDDLSESGGIWSDVEESYFWEWFRDTFYE